MHKASIIVCNTHTHTQHTNIYTATVSKFRLVEKELEVREGQQPEVSICLEMISNGPLLVNVLFDVTGINGSAIG